MPWKGVTVIEQRQRFLEDYQLNYYSITELAERFCISRKTAYKWIKRIKQSGHSGFHELSRRPYSCPWQTSMKTLHLSGFLPGNLESPLHLKAFNNWLGLNSRVNYAGLMANIHMPIYYTFGVACGADKQSWTKIHIEGG